MAELNLTFDVAFGNDSLDLEALQTTSASYALVFEKVMKGDPGLIELRRNGVTVTPVSAGVYNIIVPTKTSELQNDSNYQNGSEVASVVGAAVNIEKTRAQAAESALDGRLDAAEDDIDDLEEAVAGINTVIPSAASAQNQVADKAFVNSSIATATATFRGTFASKALLDAYTGEKDSNDYAFVQVIDAVTSLVKQYDRYKWNGTAWVFEYTLNNSSFTQAQWNAINSGLTSSDKTALDTALAFIATFGDIVTHNASEFATPSDIGNGMLTIKQNGVVIGTFAANASAAAVIELINTIYDDTAVKNRLVELEDPVSSVIAAALTLLESRVSAIEKQAREGFPSLIVDELEVRRKFNQFVSAGNSYLRGAGAPAAAVIPVDWDEANFGPWTGIPQFIGQRYLNTSSNKWYTAKGFRAISDWVQDTNA